MARRSKVIFCLLLAFLYVVVNICPLRAEALPEVMSGSATLADNIMSYYAMAGSAVANTEWISELYNSFGTSFGTIEELANQGYLVLNDSGAWEATELLVENIEQAPAYASLGLNEIFNVSAQEAAQGGGAAAASGASILAGSLGGVASNGILPLLGGVTAAYWGGIGIGTIIAHLTGLYGDCIYLGVPISSKDLISFVPSGVDILAGHNPSNNNPIYVVAKSSNDTYLKVFAYLVTSGNRRVRVAIRNSNDYNTYSWYYYNLNSSGTAVTGHRIGNISFIDNVGVSSATNSSSEWYGDLVPVKYVFANQSDENTFLAGLRDGSITVDEPNKSPDMIGEDGNLQANPNNQGGYTIPDMKPQIDPGTQAGKPLTLQDWQNFANSVNNNNNQTSPSGTPDNATLFDNIIDLIRIAIPENVPDPNPNPDPWSPPVVTPVPDPSYPDPVPDQQITENPQESENPQQTENPIDTGKPWRLPDLRNKFPFCIPWDIGKIFSKLKVNARQAPHISWRFNPPNTPIDYTFNLDLEDFEEVATLLRTLELMGFIVGLAFVTRYIIGAN